MHHFAVQVAQLTHSLCAGAEVAEKIASAEGSAATQSVVSQGSDGLYSVIIKKAQDLGGVLPRHRLVVNCVVKIAQALGKPVPKPQLQHKLAAVVAVDDALNLVARGENVDREKLAQMQRFGREFFVSILRDIV